VIEPSPQSIETLKANGASETVIEIAIAMTECLRLAADDVADSTGEDLYDDATGRGQLLYRRAHNRIIEAFEDDERVVVSTAENALHVIVDDCALSFYSAPNGLEHPGLPLTSKTKRGVVDEMQTQLQGDGLEPPALRRLVLMHQADEDGLLGAALGVLRAGRDWVWRATMYDRIAPVENLPETSAEPSYEEQPEAELPEIEKRGEDAPEEGADQNRGL
jgi:hypothetical protein